MANSWARITVQASASPEPYSTQIGPFGDKIRASTYSDSGLPVLRGLNCANDFERFHDDDFVFLPADKRENFKAFLCKEDDVILVHKGTIGKVGIIPKASRFSEYVMGNSMMRVRCDRTKLEPLFLFYWLRSLEAKQYFAARLSTVGVPQIQRPLTTLREAELPCPPLEIQRTIVKVLGSLDDKIELNLTMNKTLDAVARTLFRSWFVDFDPVHAKTRGEAPWGVDPGARFPDQLVESDGGAVPEGWRICKLGDVAELAYGEPLRESDRVHGPYPIMGSNGEIGRHERAIVKGPGIVIGRKGSAGTVTWVSEDFYPIDTAFYVVAKAPCRSIIWLYEAMRNLRLEAMVVDSGVPGLNRNVAATAELICPPSDIQESFERTIGPLRARIAANQNESRALVTLRDILLPRLMSDQIPQVTA